MTNKSPDMVIETKDYTAAVSIIIYLLDCALAYRLHSALKDALVTMKLLEAVTEPSSAFGKFSFTLKEESQPVSTNRNKTFWRSTVIIENASGTAVFRDKDSSLTSLTVTPEVFWRRRDDPKFRPNPHALTHQQAVDFGILFPTYRYRKQEVFVSKLVPDLTKRVTANHLCYLPHIVEFLTKIEPYISDAFVEKKTGLFEPEECQNPLVDIALVQAHARTHQATFEYTPAVLPTYTQWSENDTNTLLAAKAKFTIHIPGGMNNPAKVFVWDFLIDKVPHALFHVKEPVTEPEPKKAPYAENVWDFNHTELITDIDKACNFFQPPPKLVLELFEYKHGNCGDNSILDHSYIGTPEALTEEEFLKAFRDFSVYYEADKDIDSNYQSSKNDVYECLLVYSPLPPSPKDKVRPPAVVTINARIPVPGYKAKYYAGQFLFDMSDLERKRPTTPDLLEPFVVTEEMVEGLHNKPALYEDPEITALREQVSVYLPDASKSDIVQEIRARAHAFPTTLDVIRADQVGMMELAGQLVPELYSTTLRRHVKIAEVISLHWYLGTWMKWMGRQDLRNVTKRDDVIDMVAEDIDVLFTRVLEAGKLPANKEKPALHVSYVIHSLSATGIYAVLGITFEFPDNEEVFSSRNEIRIPFADSKELEGLFSMNWFDFHSDSHALVPLRSLIVLLKEFRLRNLDTFGPLREARGDWHTNPIPIGSLHDLEIMTVNLLSKDPSTYQIHLKHRIGRTQGEDDALSILDVIITYADLTLPAHHFYGGCKYVPEIK